MKVDRVGETQCPLLAAGSNYDLTLALKTRQYLDEAMQEDIARYEKEKKKQHGGEEPAGKVSGPRE